MLHGNITKGGLPQNILGWSDMENVYPLPKSENWKYSYEYKVEGDSGGKTALARMIANEVLYGETFCLVLNEIDIWPSSRNVHLFDCLVSYLGRKGATSEGDYFFFPATERHDFEALLCLCLYFVWSFTVFTDRSGQLITVTNDEFLMALSDSESEFSRLTSLFEQWK